MNRNAQRHTNTKQKETYYIPRQTQNIHFHGRDSKPGKQINKHVYKILLNALTLTFPAVGGVSMVTGHAGLAVGPGGQVAALFANAAVDAGAVAIALAGCR